jgi:hypothetical protein
MGEGFILVSDKENVDTTDCSECDGSGVVLCAVCDGDGCEECEYLGVEDECPKCKGEGTELYRVAHSEPPVEEVLTIGRAAKFILKGIFRKKVAKSDGYGQYL